MRRLPDSASHGGDQVSGRSVEGGSAACGEEDPPRPVEGQMALLVQAENQLAQARALEPDNPDVLHWLGQARHGMGLLLAQDMKIGDSEVGVPELRPEARYNRDALLISDRFSLGVDVLTAGAHDRID